MKQLVRAAALTGALTIALVAAAQQSAAQGEPQPTTPRAQATVPAGEQALGTVRIPRQVLANGERLTAGTYQIRLTAEAARPEVPGQRPELNRWVEFVQGGQVRGREVVSIVPQAEIGQVAQTAPPGSGQSRVELLREGEYLRVWINRGGNHYLIHLPVG